jgi:hypothetical protein
MKTATGTRLLGYAAGSLKLKMKTEHNPQLDSLCVKPIALKDAKKIVVSKHYMKTCPQGSCLAFGLFFNGKCSGVMMLGYAPTTEKKIGKIVNNLEKKEVIELQRTWISDTIGHNAESWMMGKVMQYLKSMNIKVALTHSGGCKNDVGFIFQASGWLYFGFEKCNDFFRTKNGEYKNLVSAMRFGRVPKETLKQGAEAIGTFLFGDGELINARRHLYLYPVNKGIRRRLSKISLPFPKDPAIFRKDQRWVEEGFARGENGK